VVAECNRLGIVIDCAHASFDTTMAVLEASALPARHRGQQGSSPAHLMT